MEPKTKRTAAYGIIILTAIGIVGLLVHDKFKYGDLDALDEQTKSQMRYKNENAVVIRPLFTESAYVPEGYYKFYQGKCNENCINVQIQKGNERTWIGWNMKGMNIMYRLGYPIIDDLTLHKELVKNPNYLDKYDSVILMHNEYVTMEMFKAITSHKNVIYLYPNALYAQVQYQKSFGEETIKLIRGHGFPNNTITNGFGWKNDNTRPYEFDRDCNNAVFYRIDNGWQLSCYPETMLTKQPEILKTVKLLINPEQIIK